MAYSVALDLDVFFPETRWSAANTDHIKQLSAFVMFIMAFEYFSVSSSVK